MSVSSNYGAEDIRPMDNEECVTIQRDRIVFEAPYPNPATTRLSVPLILPADSKVVFELMHISGQVKINRSFETEKQGLTTFLVDLEDIEAGMYFLRVIANGSVNTSRIIIQ